MCSGGCYHEAHTRYGDTTHANLHYCEWIRGWTDVCLRDLRRARRAEPRVPCASSTALTPGERVPSQPVRGPMKHLKAINSKAGASRFVHRQPPTRSARRRADVVALQGGGPPQQPGGAAHSARAARSSSRRAGKPTARAARPGSASRSSATSSTATSAASGRRTCRTMLNHAPDWTEQVRGGPEGLAQDRPGLPDERHASETDVARTRPRALSALLIGALALAVAGPTVGGAGQAGGHGADDHRRQRHDLHRHVQGRRPDLRRGDREAGSAPSRSSPASRAADRSRATAPASTSLDATLEKVEIIDIAHAHDGRHVHAEQRPTSTPHQQPAAGPARAVRDPGDAHCHQADRPLRDRRRRRSCSTT